MEYRHELKFLVSETDLCRIRNRLECLMIQDSHQAGDAYTIRSLYFDDFYDTCLSEVFSGVDNRTKYRIRLYDGKLSPIHLEKKSKHQGMTRKQSQSLTAEDCQCYLESTPPVLSGPLASELEYRMLTAGMQPKCIVEYDRSAFMEEAGNVRVTFDRDIRGTRKIEQFLEPVCRDMSLALPRGQHILEVKYDEFLPQYLLQAVDLNHLHRTSFSKYAIVRSSTDTRERYL